MKPRLRPSGLVAAMIVTAVNIPLGAPVVGLWVASRAAGDEPITMGALATFVLVAGAIGIVLVLLLSRLGQWHDDLAGRTHVRRHVSWLRPMSGERTTHEGEAHKLGALDRVLIVVVVATVLVFEIWFAFYSGSPFDARSGRD